MAKTKTDIEKVLDFCDRHAKGLEAQKVPHETDIEMMIRLAELVAYKNVINFIRNSGLK